jgi:hypothetical protein
MDALKNRTFTVAAVMFLLSAAQESRGITGYLKQPGPAPLRYSLATIPPSFRPLPESLVERQAHTNITEMAATEVTSVKTNDLVAAPETAPASKPDHTLLTAESPANPIPAPAASDLLVVSPQMLSEFFKPGADGTNSASPVVLPVGPVGFTPPSVRPSSRATYNRP